jgi:DNA-binding LytR/AlgR family response regulator
MKIKILAVDDNLNQLRKIIDSIDKYFQNIVNIEHIVDRARKTTDAIDKLNKNTYDLIFLDVDIDEMSGVELGKKIRMKNEEVEMIFVTAYPDFSMKAYEIFALNYILKPIDEEIFQKTMNKAVENLRNKHIAISEKFIEVAVKQESRNLFYNDILFLEKYGKNVKIHLSDGSNLEHRAALNDYEDELDSKNFLRCHRGYIVNISKIERYTYNDLYLKNSEKTIPVGRKFKEFIDRTVKNMI